MNLMYVASTLVAVIVSSSCAMADTISYYNLYVLDDMTTSNSSVDGAVAVGGTANLTSYSIGYLLSSSDTNLVVGGDLIVNGGSVNGTTVVGGTPSISGGWTSTTLAPSGTPLPVDFAAENTRLTSLSSLIAAQPVSGPPSVSFSTLTLTAAGSGISVFNVDQATLSSVTSFHIVAPSGATVLVNLGGTNPTMSSMGMSLTGGITESNVLYNFHEATTLNMQGIGLLGSLLAPNANYLGTSGIVLGQVVVKDFNGASSSMAIANDPFTGDLPTAVPEPATWIFLMSGLAAVVGSKRRQRVPRTPDHRMTL